ncbi:MAG: DUF4190 domain-containing protein [Clostridia bacterium]|nr:DUF4190 domain-containing protein [Clostridia bacterium]
MGKGMAITGLVLGIVALVLSFLSALPFVSFVALVLAIVALVLSVMGGKKLAANNQPKGVATGGLVVGIIAVVLSAIFALTCGLCQAGLAASDEDPEELLEDLIDDSEDIVNDAINGIDDLNKQTEQAADAITDNYEGEDVVIDMSELLQ